jgi:hypothetical protein
MSEQQFQAEVMDELKQQQENTMSNYKKLREINVNEHTEKKGQLTYLSWTWAVDQLLLQDENATWEFPEPKYFGESVMVFCNVTALGKTMKMQLPVMDNRNNAIANPDTRKISDATMRCLAKCIACFGIGLYIYAGEDLPQVDESNIDIDAILKELGTAKSKDELKFKYKAAMTACRSIKTLEAQVIQRAKEISTLFDEVA